jgi:hypothetical protein
MRVLALCILLLILGSVPAVYSQNQPPEEDNPKPAQPSPKEQPCTKEGKDYPHGTVLGDQVCINGKWEKING